ncbi:hypothetical protein AK812_SmicGene4610 [Symbiodinium microadriaticum]|uniref:Uncharacterized protein n=1 Tax=Symbiodinium microadriaticum TaxID=2951 RepID=A0A1Q9EVX3_SYMMI
MVSSSALETIVVGSVTPQQIWDQFWQSQRATIILVQCEQMVSSSALETIFWGSVWRRALTNDSKSGGSGAACLNMVGADADSLPKMNNEGLYSRVWKKGERSETREVASAAGDLDLGD